MIIPKKITIGKKTYKIEVVKHVPGAHTMGQVNYGAQTIHIATHSSYNDRKYSKRDVVDTFWHEVIHAILKDMGHDLEGNETFVNAFADRLADVTLTAKL